MSDENRRIVYCQHCGGELAEGVLPLIVPTDSPPAEPQPGEPCRCDETTEDTSQPMSTGPFGAEGFTRARDGHEENVCVV